MDDPQLDETAPISTGLYRIPDDIKGEILKALNLWQKSAITQNPILVERSLSVLKRPYSTTTSPQTIVNNGLSAPVAGSPDKLRNGINDFKAFLQAQIDQAKGEYKTSLEKIQSAFNSATETGL